jgi:hypothetical protein
VEGKLIIKHVEIWPGFIAWLFYFNDKNALAPVRGTRNVRFVPTASYLLIAKYSTAYFFISKPCYNSRVCFKNCR